MKIWADKESSSKGKRNKDGVEYLKEG